MATKSEVINLIKQKIVDSEVYVENLKGDDHLQVTVISSEFNGLSLVKQHQLVYSAPVSYTHLTLPTNREV